jgi:oligopeptide transport system ATP-binding protein
MSAAAVPAPGPALEQGLGHDLAPTASSDVLLEVSHLVKHFPVRTGPFRRYRAEVHAVCDISFSLRRGETLGLVGESGCGKSTTGRVLLRLVPATSGSVRFKGREVLTASAAEMRRVRQDLQVVFQDPYVSLNPKMTVFDILAEPLRLHGRKTEARARVSELLAMVGLSPEHVGRYPHELSGGQRQRIGIARALALEPEALVLDEPVSALDVSIQAQVLNLLEDLQACLSLAYVLIAHDLAVVRHLSHRMAIMYLGKIVELGSADDVYAQPSHPYTQALLSAVPVPDPQVERGRRRILLSGDVPNPLDPPSGCRFRTRCPLFADHLSDTERQACIHEEPALIERGLPRCHSDGHGTAHDGHGGHLSACHYADRSVGGGEPG